MPGVPGEETRLILIRHGEAQGAIDQVVSGHRSCRGLTERGRGQARALCDRLQASGEVRAQALFTSVLPRAIETEELLAPSLGGLKPERDCDFCELHPGECDGLPWEEYRQRYGFDMRAEPQRPMSPGGESLASFHERVQARLARLLRDRLGETVVIVTHGGVVSAVTLSLMSHAMHVPRPFRLQPENTSLTEWRRPTGNEAEPWLLVRYNDFAHVR